MRTPSPTQVNNLKVFRDWIAREWDNIPAEHVDLEHWRINIHAEEDEQDIVEDSELHNCGTYSCMLGWFAASPESKTIGLEYSLFCGTMVYFDKEHLRTPDYVKNHYNTDAILHCFGLDLNNPFIMPQYHILFTDVGYDSNNGKPSTETILAKIDKIMEENGVS